MSAVQVNEHYLNHVMALSETARVEARQDIRTAEGIKLLSRGAVINADVKARLLRYRLEQPLEETIRVADGVASRRIDGIAERLIEEDYRLQVLCRSSTGHRLIRAFRSLVLTSQVNSLLSVYASQGDRKLSHAVAVALAAAALGEELSGGGSTAQTLLLAGLLHDVGELYIDPSILSTDNPMGHQQWKYIAAHPIVGGHVLSALPGAGPLVGRIVQQHHERADGSGYPQGVRPPALLPTSQAVALAEMLIGMTGLTGLESLESMQAEIALKLVPGEFSRTLSNKILSISKRGRPVRRDEIQPDLAPEPAQVRAQVSLVNDFFCRFDRTRTEIEDAAHQLGADALELARTISVRVRTLKTALESTGVSGTDDLTATRESTLNDHHTLLETDLAVRELLWRIRQLERQLRIRLEQLPTLQREGMESTLQRLQFWC